MASPPRLPVSQRISSTNSPSPSNPPPFVLGPRNRASHKDLHLASPPTIFHSARGDDRGWKRWFPSEILRMPRSTYWMLDHRLPSRNLYERAIVRGVARKGRTCLKAD